jgi:hypothetical protein
MAVPKDRREPKIQKSPETREIRIETDPDTPETQTIAWHFHLLDRPHGDWGWDKLKAKDWRSILAHLVSFEGLTWAHLKSQAGGRRQGTNHHSLDTDDFCKAAKDRLKHLNLDDFETLFSLRINQTLRLYGIRDGRVLQIIWHDPHHGSKRGCYPTK